MSESSGALNHYANQLTRLLSQVGTVDITAAGFQELVDECARCATGVRREVQRLGRASPEERSKGRAQLRRLAGLHAMVEDAVRREQEHVATQIAQAKAVREALDVEPQLDETGDSCDVEG